jgi:2-polyprenyl-3-methyl-5-hydroxy-6-metoxy-1,4-benzoquinol methylase
MAFQKDFSVNFPRVKDIALRKRKAKKIINAISFFIKKRSFEGLLCLDIGCSVGIISQELAKTGAIVIGSDIDFFALSGIENKAGNTSFILSDAGRMPVADNSFDMIVCSQVYEHVPNARLLFAEIFRILKPGGLVFFSGPNRWALVEEHYHLWFLSWLPKNLADGYIRFMKKASEYYEKPRSARELRKMLGQFSIHDLNQELLTNPSNYGLESDIGFLKGIFQYSPAWLFRLIGDMVPNFNWILVKK